MYIHVTTNELMNTGTHTCMNSTHEHKIHGECQWVGVNDGYTYIFMGRALAATVPYEPCTLHIVVENEYGEESERP